MMRFVEVRNGNWVSTDAIKEIHFHLSYEGWKFLYCYINVNGKLMKTESRVMFSDKNGKPLPKSHAFSAARRYLNSVFGPDFNF